MDSEYTSGHMTTGRVPHTFDDVPLSKEKDMTQVARAPRRDMAVLKVLVGLAILAALVAAGAGMVLLVAAPESGSSTEAMLGFTAAATGISTAVFAVAAVIYAQVRNLWQYAPTWVRVTAWLMIAFAVIWSLWGSITQMR